jgi:lactoylglutathione lyase
MPAIHVIGIHHVTHLVRDLDRAVAFYEGVLNLQRKARPDFGNRGVWYEMGAARDQELHLIETVGVPDKHEGHPAFEVSDIRAAVEACRAAGARVQQDVFVRTHDNSLSAFVRDPDDNLIEFTQHG